MCQLCPFVTGRQHALSGFVLQAVNMYTSQHVKYLFSRDIWALSSQLGIVICVKSTYTVNQVDGLKSHKIFTEVWVETFKASQIQTFLK